MMFGPCGNPNCGAWRPQLFAASLLNDIGPATNFADLAEEDENLLFVKLGPVTRFGNSLRLDAIIPARYISPEGLDRMFRTRVGDVIEARVAEGHVVARLVEIVPPDETSLTDARKQVEDAVRQSIANELAAEFTNAVTEAFDVTLNREIIDQITPQ